MVFDAWGKRRCVSIFDGSANRGRGAEIGGDEAEGFGGDEAGFAEEAGAFGVR